MLKDFDSGWDFMDSGRERFRVAMFAASPAMAAYVISFFLPTVNWESGPFLGYEVFWDSYLMVIGIGEGDFLRWLRMWSPNPLLWASLALLLARCPRWAAALSLAASVFALETVLPSMDSPDILVGAYVWTSGMIMMTLASIGMVVTGDAILSRKAKGVVSR